MINFEIDGVKFNYRVAVIIRDDKNRILLLHSRHGYWFLPGGRCEAGEFSRDAVIRELKEEMGADIEIERPVFLNENIFSVQETKIHEIGIYYTGGFKDSSLYETEEIKGIEEGKGYIFKWFSPSDLDEIEIRPEIVKEKLKNIPEHMEIIENRE